MKTVAIFVFMELPKHSYEKCFDAFSISDLDQLLHTRFLSKKYITLKCIFKINCTPFHK